LTLNLADAKEDVVVVAFLANHCPAVIACEDRLFDLVKSYNGKNVKFIGVCSSGPQMADEDGIPAIKKQIQKGKYNITYGYDEDGKIGKSYGAVATPTFFVLDKDRTIRYAGKLDDGADAKGAKAYVKTAVDAVLANETIEVTETKAVGCPIPYKK
jgi:thiol-disulfide isomerase/thioredoxin